VCVCRLCDTLFLSNDSYLTPISHVLCMHACLCLCFAFAFNLLSVEVGEGSDKVWWVGGGSDLTPMYLDENDAVHFHKAMKDSCERFDSKFYPKFKKWADDYFYIPHRGEHRGVGGIFFDDLNDRSPVELLSFLADVGTTFNLAYFPIVSRSKDHPYEAQHREWQELRHGRYVEFNLVYDRGTKFGLYTPNARIESILVSLPSTVRFQYRQEPAPGSDEARMIAALREPREWV
jgi:coproporphyrinogen III oxidase